MILPDLDDPRPMSEMWPLGDRGSDLLRCLSCTRPEGDHTPAEFRRCLGVDKSSPHRLTEARGFPVYVMPYDTGDW